LLTSGSLAGARTEAAAAVAAAARSESPEVRLEVAIVEARIRMAAGASQEARHGLETALAEARRTGLPLRRPRVTARLRNRLCRTSSSPNASG
ncbi:MAG: hypothetical protein ABR563_06375, partial [Pyrinomonadaceae bacterium]